MDGRRRQQRQPSFDAGDEVYFQYGSPNGSYGGYAHGSRSQQSNAAAGYDYGYDRHIRPPSTPDHGNYDVSQYGSARPVASPPYGSGLDEVMEYQTGLEHTYSMNRAQRSSVTQSVVSYSSNVPSPSSYRNAHPIPPPHANLPSYRNHGDSFSTVSGSISERPLPEVRPLQHSSSQSSGRHPQNRTLPPPPDDTIDEDADATYDSVLQDVLEQTWMPTARNTVGQGVEDPEAFIFRTPSSYVNDRGESIGSIESASLPPRRDSARTNATHLSPTYERETVDSMQRLSFGTGAPFMISGYSPGNNMEPTYVDTGLNDSFLDEYSNNDTSVLSTQSQGIRHSRSNIVSPTNPPQHVDFDDSGSANQTRYSSNSHTSTSDFAQSIFDELQATSRPLPATPVPGRSASAAAARPVSHRPDMSIHRWKTAASDLQRTRNASITSPTETVELDLPSIPQGRQGRLEPSKLTSVHFDKCDEPWALTNLVSWLRKLCQEVTDLSEDSLVKSLINLFTYKVPMIPIFDAEALASQVVKSMLEAGVLIEEEQWVNFGKGSLSGVLWQFTGKGCYSSKVHISEDQEDHANTRCYSQTCMRKRINLQGLLNNDYPALWHDLWKLDLAELSLSNGEKEYQNAMHELVHVSMSKLRILEYVGYHVPLRLQTKSFGPLPVMGAKELKRFTRDVFGHYAMLAEALKESFILPLRSREDDQGPFVKGMSDIIRDFTKKARPAFTGFVLANAKADYLFKRERDTNHLFRKFVNDDMRQEAPGRADWDALSITAIQLVPSSKATIEKMIKNCTNPREKENLQKAYEEWHKLGIHLNEKQLEADIIYGPQILSQKLRLRDVNFQKKDLHLDSPGRKIIYESDLIRNSQNSWNQQNIKGILLDNYLIFAKVNVNGKRDVSIHEYDVNKLPIPMRLLVLENPGGPIDQKNWLPVSRAPVTGPDGPGAVPGMALDGREADGPPYPFAVRHLGDQTHTVYAHSKEQRRKWCNYIIEALQNHVNSVRSTEPFMLRVLSDVHFAFPEPMVPPTRVYMEGTALKDALHNIESAYPDSNSRGSPAFRGLVNCSTVFQDTDGILRCFVGTTSGLYVTAYDNPRGWQMIDSLAGQRVDMIAVVEDFRLAIILSDGDLYAYHIGAWDDPSTSLLQSPRRLSKHTVSFFCVGKLDDRLLILYAKRSGPMQTNFKCLEPVLQQTAPSRRHHLFANLTNHGNSPRSAGAVEQFRQYDRFYVPDTEVHDARIISKTVSIVTTGCFRIAKLEQKKGVFAVPNDPEQEPNSDQTVVETYRRFSYARGNAKPLKMFMLNEGDFLLVYEKCAVVIDKYGDITRSAFHRFSSTANSAALYGNYLILVYDDFAEILNAFDGRQRQIIVGKHMRLLDDRGMRDMPNPDRTGEAHKESMTPPRTVKIAMQHPSLPRNQLIVELIEK